MSYDFSNISNGAMRNLVRTGLSLILAVIGGSLSSQNAAFALAPHAVCPVSSYGARGDGKALDTNAINLAVQSCHAKGGGTVVFTPGVYLSGTIYLASHITLDIEKGATILASTNLADYPHMNRASEWRNTALIIADSVDDVAITGDGTIDGNGRAFVAPVQAVFAPAFDVSLTRQGQAWAAEMSKMKEGPLTMSPDRYGVLFVALHVTGLKLQNFHVIDSPNWTIKIGCSTHIRVNHIDVRNDLMIPNNDALDISTSADAVVENSYLQAGDDALVIGGPCLDGWCQAPAHDIRVHNVTLVSRSAALRIGPSARGVYNVKVDRVVVRDSNRGILIHTRSDETVDNIQISNVSIETHLIDGPWWGGGEPISISVAHWDYVSWKKVTTLGYVRHVTFSHVSIKSDSPIVLYGVEPGHIKAVRFDHLSLSMVPDRLNAILGGNLDLQPTSPVNWGVRKADLPAILVHNLDGLTLNDVQVGWQGAFPSFYTSAVACDGFNKLFISSFVGAANPDAQPYPQTATTAASVMPAIVLKNGSEAEIVRSRSTAGPLVN